MCKVEIVEYLHRTLVIYGVEVSYLALGVLGVALVALIVQLVYYLGRYGNLHRYRNNRGALAKMTPPPVSVIVVVRESNYYYVSEVLPALLTQDCQQFEVVVVDCSYSEEIVELLADMQTQHRHLHVTTIKAYGITTDHSNKLALTVGIKAARYEHLLFTTPDAYPASDKWLELMSKGFIAADVVLGYSGIEAKKGFANKMIRCSRLNASVRYLASAVRRHPYRGIASNIGYTKTLYFENKGFDHLDMNIGDDDLFLQRFVGGDNVSIVMNPRATMWQMQYGGLGWWFSLCKFFSSAFRFYPARVKRYVRGELWSRFIFFAAAGVAIWLLGGAWIYRVAPIFLLVLRLYLVEAKIIKICRRLGEKRLAWIYPIYDLFSPLSEAILSFVRRIRPNKAVWR